MPVRACALCAGPVSRPARVIITARREEKLAGCKRVNAQGGAAHAFGLLDFDKFPLFRYAARAGLMPDILVNNAGMNVDKTALEYSLEDFHQVQSNRPHRFSSPMNLPAITWRKVGGAYYQYRFGGANAAIDALLQSKSALS